MHIGRYSSSSPPWGISSSSLLLELLLELLLLELSEEFFLLALLFLLEGPVPDFLGVRFVCFLVPSSDFTMACGSFFFVLISDLGAMVAPAPILPPKTTVCWGCSES